MTKLFVSYIIVATVILHHQVQGQCTSVLEIYNNLNTIEENTIDSDGEKIKQLHHLQQVFLKCSNGKDSTYARIVHRLGDLYDNTGDIEKAIHFTKEAIAVNSTGKKEVDRSFKANSYYNLFSFYNKLYLSEHANLSLDSCIIISAQFSSKYFITLKAFEKKAYAFFNTGDYQKSVETAENGILFAKEVSNDLAEALLLSQKAQSQVALNNILEAEQNIKVAIVILSNKGINTDRLAMAYSIFADVLLKKGYRKAAILYYRKAFAINKTNEYWGQCSRDLSDLGYVYDHYLQDAPNALVCYKQALMMQDNVNDDYQRVAIYLNTGVVYWRKKDYNEALHFYQKALNALPIQFTDTTIQSNPTVNMLKLVTNDYFVSTLLSNKAEALLELYKQEQKKELLMASLKTFLLADKAVDQMRWKQHGEQSKLFWREKTKSMYEHALEACYLANDTKLAFFLMEKSRAVLLNDKLNELGALAKLPKAENIKDQEYRMQVFAAQHKWASLATQTPEKGDYQLELLDARRDFESYIKRLEKKYPAYYLYKYADDVPSLDALQSNLSHKKASFVHYLVGDSVTYILSITPGKSTLLKLAKKDFDPVQLSRFNEFCSDQQMLNNDYGSFALLANKLHETLFEPLQLPKGKVIICTDNFLIPFEALCSDKEGKHYLINEYTFSYAYSARNLLKDFITVPAKGNFIGFAPIRFQPYLKVTGLKKAAIFLQQAANYYDNPQLFTDKQATKNNFIQNISDYRVVHVFSHARADTNINGPLLFMQDSVMHLSELQLPYKLATKLVVLSACETNVGKQATGEGIYSLARGFATARVPSIAATLWKADEGATYEISIIFHKYLSRGMQKDIALQKAKLDFIKNNSLEKSLPYFWATMIIIGDVDQIEFTEKPNTGWWIGLTTIILIIFGSILFFARQKFIKWK